MFWGEGHIQVTLRKHFLLSVPGKLPKRCQKNGLKSLGLQQSAVLFFLFLNPYSFSYELCILFPKAGP